MLRSVTITATIARLSYLIQTARAGGEHAPAANRVIDRLDRLEADAHGVRHYTADDLGRWMKEEGLG